MAAILLAVLTPAAQSHVTATRGNAYGVSIALGGNPLLVPQPVANGTGPPFDYSDVNSLVGVGLPSTACPLDPLPLVNTAQVCVIDASVVGESNVDPHFHRVTSEVSVADVIVGGGLLLPPLLTLDAVTVRCTADGENVTASVNIAGGTLGGVPLAQVGPIPTDTGIEIPGILTVLLNEEVERTEVLGTNRIIINGARINLLGIAEVIVGHVECEATGPDVNLVTTTSSSSTSSTSSTSTSSTSTTSTSTTSTTVPQACSTSTTSGGAGTTVTSHELSQAGPLSFVFTYETFSVPDQITIRYEGNVVFDVGPVGTNGPVTTTVNLPASTTGATRVEVTVIGSGGTQWEYTVECPSTTTTSTSTSTTSTTLGGTTTTSTTRPVTTTSSTTTTTQPVASTTTITVPPSGTTLPVATTTTTRPPTVTPLPRTGSNLLPLVGLGMLAIALGTLVRRSEQSFSPVAYATPEPTAPPAPPEFRPVDTLPSAVRRRARRNPLDPAVSDALTAFDGQEPEDEQKE